MKIAEAAARDGAERKEARESRQGIVASTRAGIAVLTPTLGQVSMWWHNAMLDLLWPMNMGKTYIPMIDRIGGEIGQMRNRLVKLALDSAANLNMNLVALMWVDDDVIVNRMAMQALLRHDRDIASGVYFSKCEVNPEPLIFAGPSSGSAKFQPDAQFDSWGWSQGLCLVKTGVYRRMQEELDLGVDKYGSPAWYKQPDFAVSEKGQLTLGGTEDFPFFENASKLGYRPLVDCTKFAFGWHYDAKLQTGFPKQQWEQYIRMEPIVWPTKEGEVVWS